MKLKYLYLFIIACVCISCAAKKAPFNTDVYLNATYSQGTGIATMSDTLILNDSSGRRIIPIKAYWESTRIAERKLVILNPGYGGKSTGYSYIANMLAQEGYFVVTIQHDLPTDDTLPRTGDIYKLRKPFWDRGVKSIFVVDNELRARYPKLNFKNTILIGHSNGGDIAMLMATEYPLYAKTVITLDNRRMQFPRSDHPEIFSIRSSDQAADPGVLPTAEEQKKYHIKIVSVNTIHNDMGGMGTEAQKKEINDYIINFLNGL